MFIVAGPNGSGKSTTTDQFSKDGYEVIDPDRIARNLSPNSPEDYSVAAGRQAINRARENILQGKIDANGDTAFIADKDDLAGWVIESLGSERINEALKNYISRDPALGRHSLDRHSPPAQGRRWARIVACQGVVLPVALQPPLALACGRVCKAAARPL